MTLYARWGIVLALWLLAGLAQAGTKHYYYTDAQGTVLAKADAQGNIVATYDYAPYGTQVLGTPPSGPTGYTGHVSDAESGLVYMQARYYDPVTTRFLSVDPVSPTPGNLLSFNRYDYASNNPIINIDPDGRQSTMSAGVWAGEAAMANQSPEQVQRLNEINAAQAKLTAKGMAATAGGEAVGVMKVVAAIYKIIKSDVTEQVEKTVVRTTKAGEKAIRVTREDGSVIDISPRRVKEFVQNTHPKAPKDALQKVKFEKSQPGSKRL